MSLIGTGRLQRGSVFQQAAASNRAAGAGAGSGFLVMAPVIQTTGLNGTVTTSGSYQQIGASTSTYQVPRTQSFLVLAFISFSA